MKREAKGSGSRTVNKSGEKPAFAKKGRSAKPRKGFTKKSEMKGWSKKTDDKPVDYRFAKPGSKGKDVDFSKKKTNRTTSNLNKASSRYAAKPTDMGEKPMFDKRRRPIQDKENGFDSNNRYHKTDTNTSRYKRNTRNSEKGGYVTKPERARPGSETDGGFDVSKKFTRTNPGTNKARKQYTKGSESGEYGAKPERTKPFNKFSRIASSKTDEKPSKQKKNTAESDLDSGSGIRLNRYISNAGICSRREADELINAGLVSVNDKIITTLGTKVNQGDVVKFNGSKLSVEERVYVLLNKPKDTITTFDDPEGRNTVMELFDGKMKERIFPVGRLDRNTTGVLLLTNDGELAQRLMHPKYEVFKVYRATLDKPFKPTDMWTLSNGVVLEDGPIKPDAIAMSDPKDKKVVGVEIHSGKNRIIHRMFEHLEYKVDKLDRVLYADLEKGKLKRGEWRHLTEKEVKSLKRLLKMK